MGLFSNLSGHFGGQAGGRHGAVIARQAGTYVDRLLGTESFGVIGDIPQAFGFIRAIINNAPPLVLQKEAEKLMYSGAKSFIPYNNEYTEALAEEVVRRLSATPAGRALKAYVESLSREEVKARSSMLSDEVEAPHIEAAVDRVVDSVMPVVTKWVSWVGDRGVKPELGFYNNQDSYYVPKFKQRNRGISPVKKLLKPERFERGRENDAAIADDIKVGVGGR